MKNFKPVGMKIFKALCLLLLMKKAKQKISTVCAVAKKCPMHSGQLGISLVAIFQSLLGF